MSAAQVNLKRPQHPTDIDRQSRADVQYNGLEKRQKTGGDAHAQGGVSYGGRPAQNGYNAAAAPVESKSRVSSANGHALRDNASRGSAASAGTGASWAASLRRGASSSDQLAAAAASSRKKQMACELCYRAKAKCDLKTPCSRCIRFHKESECHPRTRAKKVAVACLACHQVKRMCGAERPCKRCARLGIECINFPTTGVNEEGDDMVEEQGGEEEETEDDYNDTLDSSPLPPNDNAQAMAYHSSSGGSGSSRIDGSSNGSEASATPLMLQGPATPDSQNLTSAGSISASISGSPHTGQPSLSPDVLMRTGSGSPSAALPQEINWNTLPVLNAGGGAGAPMLLNEPNALRFSGVAPSTTPGGSLQIASPFVSSSAGSVTANATVGSDFVLLGYPVTNSNANTNHNNANRRTISGLSVALPITQSSLQQQQQAQQLQLQPFGTPSFDGMAVGTPGFGGALDTAPFEANQMSVQQYSAPQYADHASGPSAFLQNAAMGPSALDLDGANRHQQMTDTGDGEDDEWRDINLYKTSANTQSSSNNALTWPQQFSPFGDGATMGLWNDNPFLRELKNSPLQPSLPLWTNENFANAPYTMQHDMFAGSLLSPGHASFEPVINKPVRVNKPFDPATGTGPVTLFGEAIPPEERHTVVDGFVAETPRIWAYAVNNVYHTHIRERLLEEIRKGNVNPTLPLYASALSRYLRPEDTKELQDATQLAKPSVGNFDELELCSQLFAACQVSARKTREYMADRLQLYKKADSSFVMHSAIINIDVIQSENCYGTRLYLNEQAEQLFGFSTKDMVQIMCGGDMVPVPPCSSQKAMAAETRLLLWWLVVPSDVEKQIRIEMEVLLGLSRQFRDRVWCKSKSGKLVLAEETCHVMSPQASMCTGKDAKKVVCSVVFTFKPLSEAAGDDVEMRA